MRCAEGVLTEGKVGSFPSFCSQLLDMASERRVVPICPGTDGPSQAPSSPLGSMGEQGLTITTHQAHSRVLEKKKKKRVLKGSATVSAQNKPPPESLEDSGWTAG